MLILKFFLVSGLVLHKAIWEILRTTSKEKPIEDRSIQLSAIKVVKIAILLGVVVQIFLPDVFPISAEPFAIRVLGTVLYTGGLLTAILARFQLGNNWANIETGQIVKDQQVVAKGIYGFIRHPIYTGDLLLLTGLELALNSWLVLGVLLLAPVVMLKAIKEEEMLVAELSGYDAYCARTKRFIPFVI